MSIVWTVLAWIGLVSVASSVTIIVMATVSAWRDRRLTGRTIPFAGGELFVPDGVVIPERRGLLADIRASMTPATTTPRLTSPATFRPSLTASLTRQTFRFLIRS